VVVVRIAGGLLLRIRGRVVARGAGLLLVATAILLCSATQVKLARQSVVLLGEAWEVGGLTDGSDHLFGALDRVIRTVVFHCCFKVGTHA
jgi:hypothetical protein